MQNQVGQAVALFIKQLLAMVYARRPLKEK